MTSLCKPQRKHAHIFDASFVEEKIKNNAVVKYKQEKSSTMRESLKKKLGFSFLLSINLLQSTLVLCQCVAPLTSIKLSQIPTLLREQPQTLKKSFNTEMWQGW